MSDRSQFAHDMAAGMDFSGHPFRPVYRETPAVPVMPPSPKDARGSLAYWSVRFHEVHVRFLYSLNPRHWWAEASVQREADDMYHFAVFAATCYRLLPLRVVCSWCQAEMSPGREPVSHGICPTCLEKEPLV